MAVATGDINCYNIINSNKQTLDDKLLQKLLVK